MLKQILEALDQEIKKYEDFIAENKNVALEDPKIFLICYAEGLMKALKSVREILEQAKNRK